MTNADVHEKVRKLLALSESPNEAEAASALEKASMLLIKHNLSMGDVIYKEVPEKPQPFLVSDTSLSPWAELLINNVTELNFCTTIQVNHTDKTIYTIIGRPINVTVSLQLIDYLVETIKRVSINRNEPTEAFKFGMVYSILKRLSEIYNPPSETKALILTTTEENDILINKLFGDNTKKKEINPDTADSGAYFRGWLEGRTVRLNDQIEKDATTPLESIE